MALEALDPGDPGKFRAVQGARRETDVAGLHAIISLGLHDPTRLLFPPAKFFNSRLKADVAV